MDRPVKVRGGKAIGLGVAIGALAVILALQYGACDKSGGTVGPSEPTVAATAKPVAAPAPTAPPTVVDPTKPAEHDAKVKNGFYSITNETGIRQFYCAAAFGVLPGGDQSASTNIFQDQGVREPKDIFSGQFPKSAACRYKQIQGDLTQAQDCKDFKWNNVLAAEVWDNPGFDSDTWVTQEPEITYGEWGACVLNPEVDDVGEATITHPQTCTGTKTRTKRTVIKEKNTCFGTYRVKSDVTVEVPEACQTTCPTPPPPEFCYYRVSGPGGDFLHAIKCALHGGLWINFVDQALQNHCRFSEPGISDDDFQLNPGQSGDNCLSKNDDE
jgi:hypothetical protein